MSKSDFPEINQINESEQKITDQLHKLYEEQRQLEKRRNALEEEEERLREWIWETDDPNVVELRRQLIAVARLIFDQEEEKHKPKPKPKNTRKIKPYFKNKIFDVDGFDIDELDMIKDTYKKYGSWSKPNQVLRDVFDDDDDAPF